LLVGLYIQGRAKDRAAREAARAVYFELAANHLNVFTALEYGAFGKLSRATYDRLLPELAAPPPPETRPQSLMAIHEAHRTAVRLLRTRAFTPAEVERLAEHLRPDQLRLMD